MTTHSPLRSALSAMAQRGSGNPVVLLNTGSYPGYSNYLNQTWTWDGTDWTRSGSGTIDASGPLPLRKDFALTYDGYKIVMYGGSGESELSGMQQDTWTFNGTTWTKQAPATIPFGRAKAEMGLITSSLKTLMFGGTNNLNLLNETWIWDGYVSTWTKAAPTSSPAARIDHSLSGGPTFCILFGGSNTNSLMNDTWKFDGTAWTQLTPTTPPSVRAGAALCYDSANTQWVLFGGKNETNALFDTYTLNSSGSAWTKKSPATSPAARLGASMCYDSQLGAVILTGGTDGKRIFDETWSWNGTTWAKL